MDKPLESARALAAARAADPLLNRHGLYLSPADGDGDGLLWFADLAALQDFVARRLWSALRGVDMAPESATDLDALFHGTPALSWDLLERANLLLDGAAQLHWWGTLKQLFEGEDPFAKDLREAWRQDSGRGPQDFSALSPGDQAAFAAFLRAAFSSPD